MPHGIHSYERIIIFIRRVICWSFNTDSVCRTVTLKIHSVSIDSLAWANQTKALVHISNQSVGIGIAILYSCLCANVCLWTLVCCWRSFFVASSPCNTKKVSETFQDFLAGVLLSNDSHELTKRFDDITLVIITGYSSYSLLKTLHWHIKNSHTATTTTPPLPHISITSIQYSILVYGLYSYSHVLSDICCCVIQNCSW